MADIFVSYARADKARVAPLVAALEAQGWSMWWDREITPGQEFDEQITREIEAARAVIVVWTPASVSSRWVRGEARLAADRGTLVPVRFEAANLPLDVRAIHTTDLDDWKENAQGIAFQELLRALGSLLKTSPRTGGALPTHAPSTLIERAGLSVCVLPFANMSNDAEQEYFSDGISEDIITDLSKVSALAVVARNTAFTFKAKSVDIKHVARQLTVSHVLEGSVRKSGNRVRITAQLIDGLTGNHIWAERYDRDLSDIFALQDEISQAIVAALKLKLLPEEKKAIEQRGTTNIEAYDLYLRAQGLARASEGHGVVRVIQIYREALALDPNFAMAWAGLAIALARNLYMPETQTQMRKDIDEAFERALALDPDAWTTHVALASQAYARRDWAGAERAFLRAIELAPPTEPSVLRPYGTLLSGLGRNREAVARLQAARLADPLSLDISNSLQMALDNVPLRSEAQAEYERSKDIPGGRAQPELWALMRIWGGEDAAGIKQQALRFLSFESLILPVHRDLAEVLDQPQRALALLRDAHDDPAYQDQTRQMIMSYWAAHFGGVDLAFAMIRRALIDMNSTSNVPLWMPTFAPLRKDPRFKEIVRELGFVDYWRSSGKWADFARPLGDDDFEVYR